MERYLQKELKIKEIYASIAEWLTMLLIGSIQLHFIYLVSQTNSITNSQLATIGLTSLALLLMVGYYFTHKRSLTKIRIRIQYNRSIKFIALNDLLLIMATMSGTLSIFYLKQWVHLPPIIVATFVATIVTLLLQIKELEILHGCDFAFYAGIFTGLTSNLNNSPFFIVLASLLTAVLYILSKNLLVGVGGRLGSFAFVAIWLTTLIAF
ncbi:MAG: hypothetical protein KBG80_11140 [Breznakibacter sp.]|jgi:hypothetical protein|nr:hypothetical protein [Breznakibacter sp.]